MQRYSFQYCQKLVVLSADKTAVLLAKRMGEADYDGTWSFIGGKMETSDETLVAGMQREKNEEIGAGVQLRILPHETYNLLFRKKDGNSMVLPHIAGQYISGNIHLNDEYSEYRWVPLDELEALEPKIDNIPALTTWALGKISQANTADVIVI